MDEINEQTENMKQIQEALSNPIGAAADFDEVCIHFQFVFSFVAAAILWSSSTKHIFVTHRMNWKQNLKS